jgi:hypothetical protein
MADNVTSSAGTADGAVFATDDATGVHHPYVKIEFGADNTQTKVSTSDPLPVVQTGTLNVGTVTTVTAVTAISNALPAGTNAIGKLAANSGVDIGDVDITSIAAGDNNIGNVDIASIAAGDNNIGNVDIASALPAGTNAIGKLAANSGVDIGDVDVTSISAGTNLIGDVGIQGRATGGLTIFRSIDLDESEEEVKATAGTVYSILAFNRTAAPLYLKFYNLTAANTTVGTSTPVITLVVPANADSDGAGFTHSVAQGYAFDTAISAAVTTGVADADTGAPGANDCVVLIGYK